MRAQPCQSRSFRVCCIPHRTLAALLVLFTLLTAACSSGFQNTDVTSAFAEPAFNDASDAFEDHDSDSDESDNFTTSNPDEAGSDGRASRLTASGAAGAEATAQLPDLGRDIIFTATLEIASTDVSAATRQAIRSIESRGGFLFSQETRGGAGGTSILTFKVLPEHFQVALNDLGSVGEIRSQSISAEDVSAVVVDLESRINTAQASVIRLRNLLDNASELETIATLENQLLQRETSLEQLRGQLRTVRNQVDLATITVYVSELLNRPGLALEAMAYQGHDGGFGCFDTSQVRSVEARDPITICYRVTNTGDTPLVDVTLDDAALGATIGSLVAVDGSVTQIDPGESVLLAHETELSNAIRVRTSVAATGLDPAGDEIATAVQATAATMRFEIIDTNDGVPSFGEVLSNSWNALAMAAIVIALLAVAIAPFASVLLVIGLPLSMAIKRRRSARAEARPSRPAPPVPPAEDSGDTTITEDAAMGA
jgi:hypothetical protein